MSDQIGQQFMSLTRYAAMSPPGQARGLPAPPVELAYDESCPTIDLPGPAEIDLGHLELRKAIEQRRSVRQYAATPLSLDELSYLLWCTQGLQSLQGDVATLRTVPSAGARHAFETYLLINRVEGLPSGLYRFLALEHKLIRLREGDALAEQSAQACLGQSFLATSAAAFFWTAVPYRMTWRYGQRGYRYLHLDAGHVCQNLYLAAEAIGCGVCAIGAFDDVAVDRLLGLDGREQFTIYIATVGKKT